MKVFKHNGDTIIVIENKDKLRKAVLKDIAKRLKEADRKKEYEFFAREADPPEIDAGG